MGICGTPLALCIFVMVISFESLLAIGLGEVIFSRKLKSPIVRTLVGIPVQSCLEECQSRGSCGSINYHRAMTICELNKGATSYSLQKTTGWIYSAKDTWPVPMPGQCNSNPCRQNQTCIETNGSYECKVEECENHNKLQNGTVRGNLNAVGSGIEFECQLGLVLVGSKHAICQATGEWSSVKDIRCERSCPVPFLGSIIAIVFAEIFSPEGINNITGTDISLLSSATILEGSNISFTCSNESSLVGNQVISCIDGTWSPVATCVGRCNLSLSYSYSQNDCVPIELCVNGYADTFQKHDQKLMSSNDYTYFLGVSESECEELCLLDNFCNSFDYWDSSTPQCSLQKLSTVNISSFLDAETWSYHQRNCL